MAKKIGHIFIWLLTICVFLSAEENHSNTTIIRVDDFSKVMSHLNHQILSKYNNTHPRLERNPIELLNEVGANTFLSLRLVEAVQGIDDFDYYKAPTGSQDVEVDKDSLGFKHFQLMFSLIDPFLPSPSEYEAQRKKNPDKQIFNEACLLRKKWEVHKFIMMEGSGPPNYWSSCELVYDSIYATIAWQDYKNVWSKSVFEQARRDIFTYWEQKAYKQAQRDCLAVVAVPALFLGAVGLGYVFLSSAAELTTIQLLARYALIGAITGGAYGLTDGILIEDLKGVELAMHSLISAGFGAATFVAFGAALKMLRITSAPQSKAPKSPGSQKPELTLIQGGKSRPSSFSSPRSSSTPGRYTSSPSRIGRTSVRTVSRGSSLAVDTKALSMQEALLEEEHLMLIVDNEAIQSVLQPVFAPLKLTVPAGISTLIITDLPEDLISIENPDIEIVFPGDVPEGKPIVSPEEPKEDGDQDQQDDVESEVEFEHPIEMPYLPYYADHEDIEIEEEDYGSYYYPPGYENPYEQAPDEDLEFQVDYPIEVPYEYPLYTPADLPEEYPFYFGDDYELGDHTYPFQNPDEQHEIIVLPDPNQDPNETTPIFIEPKPENPDERNKKVIKPLEIVASGEENQNGGTNMTHKDENIRNRQHGIDDKNTHVTEDSLASLESDEEETRQTISMNARYHDGLAEFKIRCTDYATIQAFISELSSGGVAGVRLQSTDDNPLKACDIGCGDGTITTHLAQQILQNTTASLELDIIEPLEDYIHKADLKLSTVDSDKLWTNFVNQSAETYFSSGEVPEYDLLFASHSLHLLDLELVPEIAETLSENGSFVVIIGSKTSIMSILKDLFVPKPAITGEDIVNIMKRNTVFEIITVDIPSHLDLKDVELPISKSQLTETAKNILSLMIQKNIDDISQSEYEKVRSLIIERLDNGVLQLDNDAIIISRR
ncbi:MAG: class I SAM-dependent methyltransferase [Pseudomonadota bacterium]